MNETGQLRRDDVELLARVVEMADRVLTIPPQTFPSADLLAALTRMVEEVDIARKRPTLSDERVIGDEAHILAQCINNAALYAFDRNAQMAPRWEFLSKNFLVFVRADLACAVNRIGANVMLKGRASA